MQDSVLDDTGTERSDLHSQRDNRNSSSLMKAPKPHRSDNKVGRGLSDISQGASSKSPDNDGSRSRSPMRKGSQMDFSPQTESQNGRTQSHAIDKGNSQIIESMDTNDGKSMKHYLDETDDNELNQS